MSPEKQPSQDRTAGEAKTLVSTTHSNGKPKPQHSSRADEELRHTDSVFGPGAQSGTQIVHNSTLQRSDSRHHIVLNFCFDLKKKKPTNKKLRIFPCLLPSSDQHKLPALAGITDSATKGRDV